MVTTGKTNAQQGPLKDYNAYKEFYDRETDGHILAAWMNFAGISTMKGTL